MIVLYVGTQLIASVITMVGGDKTQQRIMFALPFVFTIFIVNFEAGLIVYWITTNVWTIGQQLVVRKLYPKPQVLEETGHAGDDDGNGGKPARGKPAPKPGPATAAATDGSNGGGGLQAAARVAAQEEEALRAAAGSADAMADGPDSASGPQAGDTSVAAEGASARRGEVGGDEGARAALPRDHGRVRASSRWLGRRRGRGAGHGGGRRGCLARTAAGELPDEPVERLRAVVTRVVQALGLRGDGRRRGDRGGAAGDRGR